MPEVIITNFCKTLKTQPNNNIEKCRMQKYTKNDSFQGFIIVSRGNKAHT
jgi:hypothetical protein